MANQFFRNPVAAEFKFRMAWGMWIGDEKLEDVPINTLSTFAKDVGVRVWRENGKLQFDWLELK